jgi:sigma-E factor negative regulatory protein RseC
MMSAEEGTVTKINGDKVAVMVRRSEMCDCCGSRGICHTLGGGKDMEAEAINTAGAVVGDRVLINIKSGVLWKISLIFYMIPVAALVTGAVAGMKIGAATGADPQLLAALFGVGCAGLSFFIIKWISNRLKDKKDYTPEVVKIIRPVHSG